MKISVAVGIIVAIIALTVCLVPLKEVQYTVIVDYEDTETYYENEPYEDIETYYEDEPYEDTETYYEDEPYEDTETYSETVPLSYDAVSYVREDTIKEHRQIIIGGVVFQDEVVEVPIQVACVDVTNTDNITGSFTISFQGITPMFGSPSLNVKLDLSSSEVKTATCPAEILGTWQYNVTPSTKSVTSQRTLIKYREVEKQRTVMKYRQVEKERTLIKYRQVEKERTVTKQRPETRYKKMTLLDYLMHY